MPVIAGGVGVQVACTLNDRVALVKVAESIRQHGGRTTRLSQAQLVQATRSDEISAVVYDMEPGGPSAVDLVHTVHDERPDWPMWIYYAPRAPVMDAVAQVASLRGVWATARAAALPVAAQVGIHVRRLLSSAPGARLLRLLRRVLEPLPTEVRVFLEASLEGTGRDAPARFKVGDGTAHVRSRLRHLERLCQAASLPRPKRLLDHVLFVSLAYETFVFDLPLARAGTHMGLSRKAIDGLRQRVLGPAARLARSQPRAQFEFAVMALAGVCRVPRRTADEVVERAVHERLA